MKQLLAGVAIAALSAAVFWPGLGGGFLLDDYPNIVHQDALHADTLTLSGSVRAIEEAATGVTGRPLSVISYIADHYAAGLNPRQFLQTNILIHVLVALAACAVASLLVRASGDRRASLAWLCVAAWAMHPLNVSAVLYIVQRMAMLSALFVLVAIAAYVVCRSRPTLTVTGSIFGIGIIGVSLILGVLSKESAVLGPLLLLVIEATVLAKQRSHELSQAQKMVILGGAALPGAVVLAAFATLLPAFLAEYTTRPFSLSERLLTEARVIWLYIGQIMLPSVSDMTLYHDGFPISRGLFSPPATAAACAGILGLALGGWRLRRRLPWLSFGILFFLVGHLLESTVAPLELVFEHRNYLPAFGLLLGVGMQAGAWIDSLAPRLRPVAALAAVAFVVILGTMTLDRAAVWGDPVRHMAVSVATHPESPRVQHEAGTIWANVCFSQFEQGVIDTNACLSAADHYEQSAALDPDNAGSLMMAIEIRHLIDVPIDTGVLETVDQRLRSGASQWVNYNVLHRALAGSEFPKPLPATWLANWAESAIANPNAKRTARAAVLHGYAQLLFNRMGLPEDAHTTMRQAAALAPERMDIQINLIKLLIAMEDFDAAAKQIKHIELLPNAWAYADVLERFRKQLETAGTVIERVDENYALQTG